MATIHDITAYRKATALRYYATYNDQCGVAAPGVAGGYTFRPDTTPGTRLVSPCRPRAGANGAVRPGRRLSCSRRSCRRVRRPRLPLSNRAPLRRPSSPSHPTARRTTMTSFTAHPMLTSHDDTMIAWQHACADAAGDAPPAARPRAAR